MFLQYNPSTATFPKHIWDEAIRTLPRTPFEFLPQVQQLIGIPDDSRDPLYKHIIQGAGITLDLANLKDRLQDFGLKLRVGHKRDLVKDTIAYLFPLEDFKGLLAITSNGTFIFCNSIKVPPWVVLEGESYKTFDDPLQAIEEIAHQLVHCTPPCGVKVRIPFTTLARSVPSRLDQGFPL